MNTNLKLTIIATLLFAIVPTTFAADDEASLIALLAPNTTPQQKDLACQKLKLIGTAKSVPALGSLLTDDHLSHSARYALESIPVPEAAAALRDALPKTTGLLKAGIINSLGARRDRQAVGGLQQALKDSDANVRSAAASALGQIASPDALAALQSAHRENLQIGPALIDALLLCADNLAQNDPTAAATLCKNIYDSEKSPHHRTAAFRSLVLASPNPTALITKALQADEPAALKASLQLVREISNRRVTEAFAAVLPNLQPPVQIALLAALAQRADKSAAPDVLKLTTSQSPDVRRAALAALASLGDASAALTLAQIAARSTGPEQDAARQSLTLIRDPNLRDTLLSALPQSQPPVQAEIVRALADRHDRLAVPALIKLAQGPSPDTRTLALKSLATLADASHLPDLLPLLLSADSDPQRLAAEQALVAASSRSDQPNKSVPQLLTALKQSTAVPTRAALLRIVGRHNTPESLAALRSALADPNPTIQDAALRTLAEFAPLSALPDLLKLASDQQRTVAHRVIALRGYWRLVAASTSFSLDIRWCMCEAGLAASTRPEDIRLGLSVVATVPHPAALKLTLSLAQQESLRAEAQQAALRIAAALSPTHPADAKSALKSIEQNPASDALRADARKALAAIDQYVGYITTWSYAGPFRQPGKQCAELFDIPFPPEQPNANVTWKPLPPPADPALFWQADLLPLADGEQCVVYVRARIVSPKEQKVLLEIGSDDGNKIWLNNQPVHSKNTLRPIQPNQDSATATLKEGNNDLLIKVTQNNMGFAVCLRLRNPDGSPIDNLRFDRN